MWGCRHRFSKRGQNGCIKCIDLTADTIKLLGVHFSYNQMLQTQKDFVKSITNMQNVLKYGEWEISHLREK